CGSTGPARSGVGHEVECTPASLRLRGAARSAMATPATDSIEPRIRGRRQSPLGALEIPGFRFIFVNGLFSSVGMQSTNLVQGWLVLSLSGDSPFWVGVAVALNGVGRIVFSIVGGVLGDQLDRRKVVAT